MMPGCLSGLFLAPQSMERGFHSSSEPRNLIVCAVVHSVKFRIGVFFNGYCDPVRLGGFICESLFITSRQYGLAAPRRVRHLECRPPHNNREAAKTKAKIGQFCLCLVNFTAQHNIGKKTIVRLQKDLRLCN